jgi:hypothetical protein
MNSASGRAMSTKRKIWKKSEICGHYLKETLRLKTLDLQKASWTLFIDYILQNYTLSAFFIDNYL